ncbi:redox-sensitive bicupin YhaK (pirin superfamily) [Neorhizobium galegae]|uniref:pirin family protein n=1 Tax=Neorhizobium galegae TaxID=399 RepID=UPI001AE29776|nr:pirin-like bicupin family protein [Neorhizobium galegae]MBP2550982.1 redox-sensitive bicupin YhaK (pirin superfamily) [Neorhizobium galegae]
MTLIHESMNRGHTDTGWLNSYHTFSFGGFQDPTRMGYGALRVINEDWIAPGSGFSEHGHADMDILTLVLSGKLKHKDTLGNLVTIAPGEAQLMYAGSGVRHSEMNASGRDSAHFLQIWLIPNLLGGTPLYQQAALPAERGDGGWSLLASGRAGDAPLTLQSDTQLFIANARDGDRTPLPTTAGRLAFLHIIEGVAMLEGERLASGDAVEIGAGQFEDLTWITDGRALLFDMAR